MLRYIPFAVIARLRPASCLQKVQTTPSAWPAVRAAMRAKAWMEMSAMSFRMVTVVAHRGGQLGCR